MHILIYNARHMKPVYLLTISLWILTSVLSSAQIKLGAKTSVLFASIDEAKLILASRDEFIQALSLFDRSARLKTDQEVSEKEFLEFVGTNVMAWSDAEKQTIVTAFEGMSKQFEGLPFPAKVFMIKTTGKEEGRAAYTRANAVILPQNELMLSASKLQKTICHELFHVLSRANPGLRDKMYASIGFEKTAELAFPDNLKARKLTNPDAPLNNHCIRLKIDGNESWAIPILFSNTEKYDKSRGGEFFNYLQFRFLKIDQLDGSPTPKPIYSVQNPILANTTQISGFYEQVGRNTGYIIHPEEILADNFALMVLNKENIPSPEIIKKLKDLLKMSL